MRRAVQHVAGGVDAADTAQRELRRVGLTEQDRALLAQSCNDHRIFARNVLLPPIGTARRNHAFRIEGILDGHRHAMQRTGEIATRGALVERGRLGARTVVALHDHGVESVVDGDLAFDVRVHHFARRKLA